MAKGNGSGFFVFLTGALVGGILGILYAPDKGENTRDKLNFQLDKYAEKLQKILDDLIEGKDFTVSEAKTEGEKVILDAIKEAEKLKNEVEALKSKIAPKAETN
ncbi:MAG: YtxH domain-containing protein [Flammeovirgaceae bacterium]|nr:YtxH domain-containing protein [Flammeovirgaceae bacterium]